MSVAAPNPAAEIVSIADTLVGRLSSVCDSGNKLREYVASSLGSTHRKGLTSRH